MVITVVDITKDAPLIVNLSGVGVVSDGFLHLAEDGGWLLLDDVEGGTMTVGV